METSTRRRVSVVAAGVALLVVLLTGDLASVATAGGSPTGWIRTEQSAGSVALSGVWAAKASSGASANSYSRAKVAASKASYTFIGTGVRLIGLRSPAGGITEVRLDGTKVARVDTYATSTKHQRVLFERTGLAPATHTIEAVVTGKRNRKARRGYTAIDAIDVSTEVIPPPTGLSDDFESFGANETWADGSTHGAWLARYNGYGSVGTTTDGSIVHHQRPKRSTSLDETHAGLVTTTDSFTNFHASVRTRTVAQLRTPTPNAWETAWVVWDYTHDEHFYYFIAKPNGWELGKVDNTKIDPAGPKCEWPSYKNCKYDGAQRYLATGSSPTFPVGPWYQIDVRQNTGTLVVSVDGVRIVSFTDTDNPYTHGAFGLYNEDAEVVFDDVQITPS